MNIPDFHLHTRFSSDSEASPEDIIKAAAARNIPAICFTDHNDFDFPLSDGEVMFNLDFDSYINYFEELRERFRDKYPIYIGVEQGLAVTAADRIDSYDPDKRLDFIIGSSHLVDGKDPYEKSFWENVDIKKALDSYYESILDNVLACNNYDVYGHLDYIARYNPDRSYPYKITDYFDIIEEIFKQLIQRGKGIEVNTAGLRYFTACTNPGIEVLKLYKSLGGEIITVGSDAHKPEDVSFYHNTAKDLLLEAGFKYITYFNKRKPEFKLI